MAITDFDRIKDEIPDFLSFHAPHTKPDDGNLEPTVQCYRRHFPLPSPQLSSAIRHCESASATMHPIAALYFIRFRATTMGATEPINKAKWPKITHP